MISRRTLLACGISLVLMAVVLWIADIGTVDWSRIEPIYILPALAAYIAVLVLRGLVFKKLANLDRETGNWPWISLAGRHQLIFILAPSGTGDLVFPALAKRRFGLGLIQAGALIAGARFRDISTVLCLGCCGLALAGYLSPIAWGAALCFGLMLLFATPVSAYLGTHLKRLRGAEAKADAPAPDAPRSFAGTPLLVLLLWLSASGGIAAGFAAAGHPLSLPEVWIMLAGLNIAGAIAVSIAGLGVAEAGAAGVLVFLGTALPEAAAVAIVARPLLLLLNTAASGVIEIASRLTNLNDASA